jgi:uncharacterized protein YbcV (DUF1398 family)
MLTEQKRRDDERAEPRRPGARVGRRLRSHPPAGVGVGGAAVAGSADQPALSPIRRGGSAERTITLLGDYLRALRDIGVEAYDSHIADGHSEYSGADGQILVGLAFHETFAIAETCDREELLRYMQQVEKGGVDYAEMSKALADNGVEKWTFDTDKLTITYLDKAGNVLLHEKVE